MDAALDSLLLASLVVERLRLSPGEEGHDAQWPPLDAEVLDGLEFDPDSSGSKKLPVVVVLPGGEDPTAGVAQQTGALQRVKARVNVVIGVQALNDLRGSQALSPLRDLRRAAMARLVGWRPSWDDGNGDMATSREVLEVERCRLAQLDKGRAWWQDDFTVSGWLASA